MANVAVIYYSSTGNTYAVAEAIAAGARAAGSEVRLRKVRELAPDEAIASNQGWEQHLKATGHVEEATLGDLEWADAFAFGSPTRFGQAAAQLKQFVDTTGPLWQKGVLANKAATAFTGAASAHGGHETTIQGLYATFAHWGSIVVPLGYTIGTIFQTGNPHGSSYTDPRGGSLPPEVTAVAKWQGERLARVADALVYARATIAAPPTEGA
jgi:NAD(P)H dehydrogenase (quinone)